MGALNRDCSCLSPCPYIARPAGAQAASQPDVSGNAADSWDSRSLRLAAMEARGPGCFDFNYYLEASRPRGP